MLQQADSAKKERVKAQLQSLNIIDAHENHSKKTTGQKIVV
jgi:hypothetical protein